MWGDDVNADIVEAFVWRGAAALAECAKAGGGWRESVSAEAPRGTPWRVDHPAQLCSATRSESKARSSQPRIRTARRSAAAARATHSPGRRGPVGREVVGRSPSSLMLFRALLVAWASGDPNYKNL